MQPLIAVPAVALLVLRAYSNNSLTPLGIVVAALTAMVHAVHPWSIFFALLVVFFLGGSAVTKVFNSKSFVTFCFEQSGSRYMYSFEDMLQATYRRLQGGVPAIEIACKIMMRLRVKCKANDMGFDNPLHRCNFP